VITGSQSAFDRRTICSFHKEPGLMGKEFTECQSPRVLVADDEKVIADTLSTILSLSGYSTMTAYNGARAVQQALEWHPDLFLSDIAMPEMNGIDAAIRIRTIHPDCRVLLFSGQGAIEDLVQNSEARGYDFEILSKPLHPEMLLRRLKAKLRE
jgi:CheY-like chemotaxis protein